MKMFSSFTHPHVIPNLYEFLSYVEHKRVDDDDIFILG